MWNLYISFGLKITSPHLCSITYRVWKLSVGCGVGKLRQQLKVSTLASQQLYANSWERITIYRLVRLDPALPGFSRRPELYLEQTDAAYVDIIHTNGGLDTHYGQFGYTKPMGHRLKN
jgi:hypothetical protein